MNDEFNEALNNANLAIRDMKIWSLILAILFIAQISVSIYDMVFLPAHLGLFLEWFICAMLAMVGFLIATIRSNKAINRMKFITFRYEVT